MKDIGHHPRHTQRKVLRSIRKESSLAGSFPSKAAPELPLPEGIRLSQPKRSSSRQELPKMVKNQSYH